MIEIRKSTDWASLITLHVREKELMNDGQFGLLQNVQLLQRDTIRSHYGVLLSLEMKRKGK